MMKGKTAAIRGGLGMVFLLVVAGILTPGVGAAPEVRASDSAPKTLAILPFENNAITDADRYEPLSKGLSAMLITDLNRSGTGLRLIERTKIQSLLKRDCPQPIGNH